jgi:hypothetical protein
MKGFEKDGDRWAEANWEAKLLMFNEDFSRAIIEAPPYGFRCFTGTVEEGEIFNGESEGVLNTGKKAILWMLDKPTADLPMSIDGKSAKVRTLRVPLLEV